jgi:putative NADH-flavin reductase
MRVLVIGATGYVGRRVRDEALGRGHVVTAVVRDTSKLPTRSGLNAVRADVQDSSQLASAAQGHDVVISCFNPGGHDVSTNPHFYRDIVEGTRAIIEGVRRSGVRRLVYVGGAGSLYSRPDVMLIDDVEFLVEHLTHPPAGMLLASGPVSLDIPRAARMAYYLFEREQELEWTFVSPSLCLGDYGGRTGRLRYGTHDLLMENGGPARVDVEDLAIAVVDEAEAPRQIRGHLTVATEPAGRETA